MSIVQQQQHQQEEKEEEPEMEENEQEGLTGSDRQMFGTDLLPRRQLKIFHIRKRNTLRRHTFSHGMRRLAMSDRADDDALRKTIHYSANVSPVCLRRRRVVAAELEKLKVFFQYSSVSRHVRHSASSLRLKDWTYLELLEHNGEEVFFDNGIDDFWDGTWQPRRRYLVKCFCFRPYRFATYARNERPMRFFETDSLDFIGKRLTKEQRRDANSPINYIEPAKINLAYFKTVVAESRLELDDFIDGYARTRLPLADNERARSHLFCRLNRFFGIKGEKEALKRTRESQKQQKKEDLHAELQGHIV